MALWQQPVEAASGRWSASVSPGLPTTSRSPDRTRGRPPVPAPWQNGGRPAASGNDWPTLAGSGGRGRMAALLGGMALGASAARYMGRLRALTAGSAQRSMLVCTPVHGPVPGPSSARCRGPGRHWPPSWPWAPHRPPLCSVCWCSASACRPPPWPAARAAARWSGRDPASGPAAGNRPAGWRPGGTRTPE